MKKLNIYNKKTPIDFFVDAVNRKRDPQFARWLSRVQNSIDNLFNDYHSKLLCDALEQLPSLSWLSNDEINFKNLYSFKAIVFKELYIFLTTKSNNVVDNVCPYCFLEPSESLDHYVPQTPFPHFSADPQNLIPCCSNCNSKKNDDWRTLQGGKMVRLFLNAYIDDVMKLHFLDVKFHYVNDLIIPEFFISQNQLPSRLFDIVKSHFEKLDLATRYRNSSYKVFVELGNSIKSHKNRGLSDALIRTICLDTFVANENEFGLNHWETVLKKACITDPVAYNYLITH